jgi:hypothetical protein
MADLSTGLRHFAQAIVPISGPNGVNPKTCISEDGRSETCGDIGDLAFAFLALSSAGSDDLIVPAGLLLVISRINGSDSGEDAEGEGERVNGRRGSSGDLNRSDIVVSAEGWLRCEKGLPGSC